MQDSLIRLGANPLLIGAFHEPRGPAAA
jgi:hypothetical protein